MNPIRFGGWGCELGRFRSLEDVVGSTRFHWVGLQTAGVPLRLAAVGRTLQHQLVQVACQPTKVFLVHGKGSSVLFICVCLRHYVCVCQTPLF